MRSRITRFIPPVVGDALRSAAMYLQYRKTRHLIESNRAMKGLHKGRRCFILATGPSIKQEDLTPLKDELCISVSNFFVHELYDLIKPSYHCIAPWHPPITLDQLGEWMKEVQEKTMNSTLVLSASDHELHQENSWFPGRNVVYLSLIKPPNISTSYRRLDCSGVLPAIHSVPVMAIYLALHLGCSPIYLLGVDHDWILHFGESRHFYEEGAHAMGRKGYDEWKAVTLSKEFQGYANLWTQYEHIRDKTEVLGVEILNATRGGMLDVFPRRTLNTLWNSGTY